MVLKMYRFRNVYFASYDVEVYFGINYFLAQGVYSIK